MVLLHNFDLLMFLTLPLFPYNMLLNLIELIFYHLNVILLCSVLYYFMHCTPFANVTPACLEVVCFPAASSHLPMCWTLSMQMKKATVTKFFFVSSGALASSFAFCSSHPDLTASKPFISFKLPSISACDLCASTYLAHPSTCSLVTILMPLKAIYNHV